MGHQFAAIAFTDGVKNVQLEHSSRANYANMEQGADYNHLLGQREADFIAQRDSFYMASVSETGWPYVQHRGGPAGFIRIIDAQTIGFADFSGNRQYVSTGNFRNDARVALILVDYPNRTRLKILGRVTEIAEVDESDGDTLASLKNSDYAANVERGFLIHIEGFDWNCPQHITPRYTEADVEQLLEPLRTENRLLRDSANSVADLDRTTRSEPRLGEGPLELVISAVRQLTPRVRGYELRSTDGSELPEVAAGAHLKIPVQLDNGEITLRHYSISSDSAQRETFEIAVLNEAAGTGGSKAIHEKFSLGQVLGCEYPQNNFELHSDDRPAVLIAGGIGITPIKAMAHSLVARANEFTLHYAGRSQQEMAFSSHLQGLPENRLSTYSSSANERMDLAAVLAKAPADSIVYVCGPAGLLKAVAEQARLLHIGDERIRFERFTATIDEESRPITVHLQRSQQTLEVPANQTILDAILESGISAAFSCKTGICKSCAVEVVEGTPEHRDAVLSEADKTEKKLICPCVSRAKSAALTLDL